MLNTPIPRELVAELDKQFRSDIPSPKDKYPDLMYKAGMQYVVEYIRTCQERQEKEGIGSNA
jgi:hypothetical protein